MNPSLVLHRVQVTPTAMPPVVPRTRQTALRTARLSTMLDVDLHRAANHRTPATRMALLHAKHHLPHTPRRLDPQQPLERLGTLHPASLWPIGSLSPSSMPTQQPEDPHQLLRAVHDPRGRRLHRPPPVRLLVPELHGHGCSALLRVRRANADAPASGPGGGREHGPGLVGVGADRGVTAPTATRTSRSSAAASRSAPSESSCIVRFRYGLHDVRHYDRVANWPEQIPVDWFLADTPVVLRRLLAFGPADAALHRLRRRQGDRSRCRRHQEGSPGQRPIARGLRIVRRRAASRDFQLPGIDNLRRGTRRPTYEETARRHPARGGTQGFGCHRSGTHRRLLSGRTEHLPRAPDPPAEPAGGCGRTVALPRSVRASC